MAGAEDEDKHAKVPKVRGDSVDDESDDDDEDEYDEEDEGSVSLTSHCDAVNFHIS